MACSNNEFGFDMIRGPRQGTTFHIDREANEVVVSCGYCGEVARHKLDKVMTLNLAHEDWCPVLKGVPAIGATVGRRDR